MATAAIDTLRYAEKLKEGGVETSTASQMARALNDELVDYVPTKVELEPRFAAIEAAFEAMDARFEALETKFEARFDALEAKIDSLATSLKVTNAMMVLGFALLGTLGLFQLTRDSSATTAPVVIERLVPSNTLPVEATP